MSSETLNEALGFTVSVEGREMTQPDSEGVQRILVEDHVEMVGLAEVTINGEGQRWGHYKLGQKVEITMTGSGRKVFVGYVTGMRHYWKSGVETLTLIALDPLCKLAASRRTRVFEEMSDSDVVSSVLGEAGLTSGSIDSTSGSHDYIFQRNESDLVLLKRLAARNGYLLMANEGKIDFVKAQFSGNSKEIGSKEIMLLDYSFSTQNIPSGITVYGWDYHTKERVEGSAGSGDVDTIGGGKNAASETGDLWQGDSYISDVLVTSQSGAEAVAKAEYNRLARNFLRGKVVVQGDATIHAGTKVKLTDKRDGFNPEGYVVSSRHIMDETGYRTEIMICSNTYPD